VAARHADRAWKIALASSIGRNLNHAVIITMTAMSVMQMVVYHEIRVIPMRDALVTAIIVVFVVGCMGHAFVSRRAPIWVF
jgi:hypothetical protein